MKPPVILTAIQLGQSVLNKQHVVLVDLWRKFGAAIRADRRARKIPLKAFARRLGYTPTMVSYLEAGERQWDMEKAKLAVKLLTRREAWPQ